VPSASEAHYLLASKVGMLIILGLSIAVVFNVLIITDVAIFMLQLSAAELPANWAQWWWWRFNGKARVAASFGGAAIFCVVVLGPKLLGFLGVPWADKLVPEWWWQTFIVMGLTTILWVTVALVTKPDPEPLLRKFHERARPLGWWGPFRDEESTAQARGEVRPIIRGITIAAVGTAATSLFILGLTYVWFGRYIACVVALVTAAVLFFAFSKLTKAFLDFLTTRATDNEYLSVADSQGNSKYNEKEEDFTKI
jgi:hypothetical protein